MGRGGVRPGPRRGQTRAALGGLLGLPLVPCDGARVVREPGHRRGHERGLRQREGGPRGAPRRRPHLHAGRAVDDRARRLADDGLFGARWHAVLRRHLLSTGGPPRPAGLPQAAGRHRRCLALAPGGGHAVGQGAGAVARPDRPGAASDDAAERRAALHRLPGPFLAVRRGVGWARRGAEVPAADDLAVRAALLQALRQPLRAAHGSHDADSHGTWRNVRPARWRLRAVLGRRALDDSPLREDALRQRPARLTLPPRLARLR